MTTEKGGRPKTDQAKLDAAIALIDGGEGQNEACRRAGVSKGALHRELERRRKERRAAASGASVAPAPPLQAMAPSLAPTAAPVQRTRAETSARVEVPQGEEQGDTSGAPADRVERARVLRRMFAAGAVADETLEAAALTWGCSVAEVQEALDEAAREVVRLRVPKELRELESRARWEKIRNAAAEAHDWRSEGDAQRALDALDGIGAKAGKVQAKGAAGTYTRADMASAISQLRASVVRWPEALAAFDAVLA